MKKLFLIIIAAFFTATGVIAQNVTVTNTTNSVNK